MFRLLLIRVKIVLLIFILVPSFAFCLQAPKPSAQAPPAKTATPKKPAKVWTNEDLNALTGGVSVVGSGAPAARSNRAKSSWGQPTDDISIINPRDGTVVHPGDTISVDVEVSARLKLTALAIVSPMHIGAVTKSPPYTFTVQIPQDEEPGAGGPLIGQQPIYAIGTTEGHGLQSAPATVDVEALGLPTSLNPQIPSLSFESLGDSFPLIMLAKFADGAILEVNNSTYFSFSSSDAAVATVDDSGMVKAVGSGNAFVIATYRCNGQVVQTNVPVAVAPQRKKRPAQPMLP